jgi:lipase ATG15
VEQQLASAPRTLTSDYIFLFCKLTSTYLTFNQPINQLPVLNPSMTRETPAIFTVLESSSLKKVSYYKEVTKFIETLKLDERYPSQEGWEVVLTGHSLGGGLAIISGAQTATRTVSFSGPNAILSRHQFEPPVEIEALDKYVFNVIPDRDPIPMTDDPARLRQYIDCTASMTDVVACHSINRSMCELLYKCGADGRPIPCACVTKYKYDAPLDDSAMDCPNYEA